MTANIYRVDDDSKKLPNSEIARFRAWKAKESKDDNKRKRDDDDDDENGKVVHEVNLVGSEKKKLKRARMEDNDDHDGDEINRRSYHGISGISDSDMQQLTTPIERLEALHKYVESLRQSLVVRTVEDAHLYMLRLSDQYDVGYEYLHWDRAYLATKPMTTPSSTEFNKSADMPARLVDMAPKSVKSSGSRTTYNIGYNTKVYIGEASSKNRVLVNWPVLVILKEYEKDNEKTGKKDRKEFRMDLNMKCIPSLYLALEKIMEENNIEAMSME